MTERLMTLLHREADLLDVPPPPTTEILGAGRTLRRRRTRAVWAATAAVALVVAGGAAAVRLDGRHERAATPAAPTPSGPFAWAVDDTVYVGGDARAVQMPEVAQTLYYTSAGILVRTNKDGSSDGGAPFHFELVADDGTATRLGVTLGEVVPGTDPTEPYLAWATRTDGGIQVVVHDVTTDRDVATVDVPGTATGIGWAAPPVALSGDLVYVGTDDRATVVNWRTGETSTTSAVPARGVPEVAGGRTVTSRDQGGDHPTAAVVDVSSGRDVLDIPIGRYDQVTLSPDGRFAMVSSDAQRASVEVYDVDAGTRVSVAASPYDVGWTPQDDLFQVHGDRLEVCSAATGDCRTTTVSQAAGHGLVRYTGRVYES